MGLSSMFVYRTTGAYKLPAADPPILHCISTSIQRTLPIRRPSSPLSLQVVTRNGASSNYPVHSFRKTLHDLATTTLYQFTDPALLQQRDGLRRPGPTIRGIR
jgi:hypothetical protein